MKNNARLTDPNTLIQAGIDPKTGLPIKMTGSDEKCTLKLDIKKALRVLDEQNAINRYKWYNLPNGLDGQLLERILYYKGQGMFFYSDLDEQFYFLPYALAGTIDIVGRFNRVAALPFNGSTENKPIEAFTRNVVYDVVMDIDKDTFMNGCVLLSDYSKQISQTNISRQILNDPILDTMAEALPLARTSLIANSGVRGMRVADEDAYSQVQLASEAITKAALIGKPLVPIVSPVEFQDLTNGNALRSDEYLMYMQALDNFRLSLYGLDNGGLFDKKAYVNNETAGSIQNNVGLVYQDGLTNRQKFCDIVNSIWGLGIWCDVSETVANMDMNMDGLIADSQDQSGQPGEQPTENVEVTDNA